VPSVLLAFLSALVWGSADYCGGRATVRGGALGVTVVSQLLGLPVLAICLVLLPGRLDLSDLTWGAGAGAAGVLGIVALYQGLATGAMSIVAPITAVTGALVPLSVGLATGDRPGPLALTGAGCAIVAIGLVSMSAGDPTRSAGQRRAGARIVVLALTAGALFGIFFTLLAQTHADSGMWPLASARVVSVGLGLVLVLTRGASMRMPRAIIGWVAAAGAGDIAANALYLLSARGGMLSVVAPIAALYPVSTVLLAVGLDRERVRFGQLIGLGLAATALVLTAV
jgi:drug/metabolite transporter (DMT)-like permease